MKYKTTVYRVLTQSIEIEVEAPWPSGVIYPNTPGALRFSKNWVRMQAEDLAAEESDHDWRDEGWEFDEPNFQAVALD